MKEFNFNFLYFLVLTFLCDYFIQIESVPDTSDKWYELIPTEGAKFTARYNHATCQFTNQYGTWIFLTGGSSESHPLYNFQLSTREYDVWYSSNGERWGQMTNLTGDFYKQNDDARQRSNIAPWYQRYGHSLNALNYTGTPIMIQLGGYAPNPINDQWVTENGWDWVYAEFSSTSQIWSPRAWHRTTLFKDKLYMLGGSPLNNEVWMLDSYERVNRPPVSGTRSMVSPYTYHMTWIQVKPYGTDHWSPRVGFGLFSQFYHNTSDEQSYDTDAQERLILIGGYGGFPKQLPAGVVDNNTYATVNPDGSPVVAVAGDNESPLFDGYGCRSDVWESYDGFTWFRLAASTAIGERAWFGHATWHHPDEPRIDASVASANDAPRLWVFGGGNLGYKKEEGGIIRKVIRKIDGRSDGLWSRDAINWYSINYVEGGGNSETEFFSSEEWSKAVVDGSVKYLGVWGHSILLFSSTQPAVSQSLYFIGGDRTGPGDSTESVFRSLAGLFCDKDQLICGGKGECKGAYGPGEDRSDGPYTEIINGIERTYPVYGCQCNETFGGEYCEINLDDGEEEETGATSSVGTIILILAVVGGSIAGLSVAYTMYNKS